MKQVKNNNKSHNNVRSSFSAVLLTDAQFSECEAITEILKTEIHTSGKFKDKLGDYAFAFARTNKFDAAKSEIILRDIFKERNGRSMNDLREALQKREEQLTAEDVGQSQTFADGIGPLIETGHKMTFYRAFAEQATKLAEELQVTAACAKRLMKEEFAAANGRELYDWGKELEEQFYRPQVEAEGKDRKTTKSRSARAGGARPRP